MRSFKCFFLMLPLLMGVTFSNAYSAPGDYTLRIKAGPSFELNDFENQGRLGGEFDYDFGYNLGFNLMAMFGFSDTFRFDLIPSARVDYLILGPAAMYGVLGAGYTAIDKKSALGMRLGTGLSLPLGEQFEFNTDINMFLVPLGTPGTQLTFDWFLGLGFRFH